jgi:hypothetical protein
VPEKFEPPAFITKTKEATELWQIRSIDLLAVCRERRFGPIHSDSLA